MGGDLEYNNLEKKTDMSSNKYIEHIKQKIEDIFNTTYPKGHSYPEEFKANLLLIYNKFTEKGLSTPYIEKLLINLLELASSPEKMYLHLEEAFESLDFSEVLNKEEVKASFLETIKEVKKEIFIKEEIKNDDLSSLSNQRERYITEYNGSIGKDAKVLFEYIELIKLIDDEILDLVFTSNIEIQNQYTNERIEDLSLDTPIDVIKIATKCNFKEDSEITNKIIQKIEENEEFIDFVNNMNDIYNVDFLKELHLSFNGLDIDNFNSKLICELDFHNEQLISDIETSLTQEGSEYFKLFESSYNATENFFSDKDQTLKEKFFFDVLSKFFGVCIENKNEIKDDATLKEKINKITIELNENSNNLEGDLNPTKIGFFKVVDNRSDEIKALDSIIIESKRHLSAYGLTNEDEAYFSSYSTIFFLNFIDSNISTMGKPLSTAVESLLSSIESKAVDNAVGQMVDEVIGYSKDYLINHYLTPILEECKSSLKPEIYNEIYTYFYGEHITNHERMKRFSEILDLANKLISKEGITRKTEEYRRVFETAFMFYTLDNSLSLKSEESNDVFTEQNITDSIARKIINFDLNNRDGFGRETSLAVYLFNKKAIVSNMEIDLESKPVYLNLAFNANMIFELGIELGNYKLKRMDCYDAVAGLVLFGYFDFQVKNKEELQITFDYIFGINKDIDHKEKLMDNKDKFLKIIENSITYQESKFEDRYTTGILNLYTLYFIVDASKNHGNLISNMINKGSNVKFIGNINGKEVDFENSYIRKNENSIYEQTLKSYILKNKDFLWWWGSDIVEDQLPMDLNYLQILKPTPEGLPKFIENPPIGIPIHITRSYNRPSTPNSEHFFIFAYDKSGKLGAFDFIENITTDGKVDSNTKLNRFDVKIEDGKMMINNAKGNDSIYVNNKKNKKYTLTLREFETPPNIYYVEKNK